MKFKVDLQFTKSPTITVEASSWDEAEERAKKTVMEESGGHAIHEDTLIATSISLGDEI